jgi:hypothetical protein
MNNNKAAQFPFSFHDAKDYLMEWPLQSWPKIPRRYPVTRYDKLAEILVSHPYTWVVNVRPVDCQIVERVFGLKLSIKDNETLWPSTRRLALRNESDLKLFKLLEQMWETYRATNCLAGLEEYSRNVAVAIEKLEGAFLTTADQRRTAAVENRSLLTQYASLSVQRYRKKREPLPKKIGPFVLRGVDAFVKEPQPWPQGY